tara:strand:+ start:966 stop:1265 length:300 start_codon:yes stop_codon:yes gene_type:complete
MLLREITSEDDIAEGLVWARKGKQVVRKYRCVGGARHGRIVATPAKCYTRIDPKKRANLKRMKARLGARLVRKTKRTKRTNPASKRVAAMNKSAKGRRR